MDNWPYALPGGRWRGFVVRVLYRDRSWEVKPGSTVRHIIEEADLNPESVLALRDGKLIHDATLTENGDTIKLVSVVSGG